MADDHLEPQMPSESAVVERQDQEVTSSTKSVKRCSFENIAPSPKLARTSSPETDGGQEAEKQELDSVETEVSPRNSPPNRRKSWRRATLSRRSLPALPHPYQVLCRSISTSLTHQERLQKLMMASMTMAIERAQSTLQTAKNVSLDLFHAKVQQMLKKGENLAQSIQSERHGSGSTTSLTDPLRKTTTEKINKAINTLEAESESWEMLLIKHKEKAEQLKRKVKMGQESSIAPDSTALTGSSQFEVVQSKPNYNLVLKRQQPILQTMTFIMDTQCKMVKNLLSIRDQSQMVVKMTSGQLAAESELPELSSDLVKNLIAQPLASAQ